MRAEDVNYTSDLMLTGQADIVLQIALRSVHLSSLLM